MVVFLTLLGVIGLILLWLGWINIVGDNDQRAGAGLAAFMLLSIIVPITAVVGIIWFIFK
jgi:uncharacterized membrane protein